MITNMLTGAIRKRMMLSDKDQRTSMLRQGIGSSTKVDIVQEEKEQEIDVIGIVKGDGGSAKTTLKDRL